MTPGSDFNWKLVDTQISLHDPESGLSFHTCGGGDVEVSYRDWQNRPISIRFVEVAHFSWGFLSPVPGMADGQFYFRDASPLIDQLRECRLIGEDDSVCHFLFSTSDDEWCEVVASHVVTVAEDDAP